MSPMVQRFLDDPAEGSRRQEGPRDVQTLPNILNLIPSGLEKGEGPLVYSLDASTRSAAETRSPLSGSSVDLGTGLPE